MGIIFRNTLQYIVENVVRGCNISVKDLRNYWTWRPYVDLSSCAWKCPISKKANDFEQVPQWLRFTFRKKLIRFTGHSPSVNGDATFVKKPLPLHHFWQPFTVGDAWFFYRSWKVSKISHDRQENHASQTTTGRWKSCIRKTFQTNEASSVTVGESLI